MIVFGRKPHWDVNRSHTVMNRIVGVATSSRSPRLRRGLRFTRKYPRSRATNTHASYRRATADTMAIAARGWRHFTASELWNRR